MLDFIYQNASKISLSIFFTVFLIMFTLEKFLTYKNYGGTLAHYFHNIIVSVFNTFILRFALPVSLIFIASFSGENAIGLFNSINLPLALNIIFGLLFFDLVIYWQHRLMHDIPFLWKIHGAHHSDQIIDVSTGIRFHILEILFSYAIKIIFVLSLGLHPITVLLFECLLNAFSLFVHSNIKLPKAINLRIKKALITPDLHRVHHSIFPENIAAQIEPIKTYSAQKYISFNFGTSLLIWDKVFKSYRESSEEETEPRFGRVEHGETIHAHSFWQILREPFN